MPVTKALSLQHLIILSTYFISFRSTSWKLFINKQIGHFDTGVLATTFSHLRLACSNQLASSVFSIDIVLAMDSSHQHHDRSLFSHPTNSDGDALPLPNNMSNPLLQQEHQPLAHQHNNPKNAESQPAEPQPALLPQLSPAFTHQFLENGALLLTSEYVSPPFLSTLCGFLIVPSITLPHASTAMECCC